MGEEATPQSNPHHSSLTAPIFPDRVAGQAELRVVLAAVVADARLDPSATCFAFRFLHVVQVFVQSVPEVEDAVGQTVVAALPVCPTPR